MSRSNLLRLSMLLLIISARPMLGATYVVGSCKPSLPSYPTINAALNSAPAGSVVQVCPGVYPEQLAIFHPLTLQGISAGNSSRVVITMPPTGINSTGSILLGSIAPQIWAESGAVNISNIIIDGMATVGTNCPPDVYYFAGLFYSSGTSGVVNNVEVRNQNCINNGLGIMLENQVGVGETVTIQNSNIHDVSTAHVWVYTQSPPSLTAYLKGNTLTTSNSYGVILMGVAGTVSTNVISGTPVGIDDQSTATVSGNTVTNAGEGIEVAMSGATVTSNKLLDTATGILFNNVSNLSNVTAKTNTITKTSNTGIDFECSTGNIVTGNTINGAAHGMTGVPAAFTGANKFYNVGTIRTNGAC